MLVPLQEEHVCTESELGSATVKGIESKEQLDHGDDYNAPKVYNHPPTSCCL